MGKAIQLAGEATRRLSAAAVAEKRAYDHVRWLVLGLAIIAALLGALTSTFIPAKGWAHWGFAGLTALVLGLGPFLTQRFLSQTQATRWIAIRAAAEALKREVYKRATRCKPYDGAPSDADTALVDEKEAIEKALGDVRQAGLEELKLPTSEIDADTYIATRAEEQIDWLRKRADAHSATAKKLWRAEFVIAFIGVALTAVAAAAGEQTSTKYFAPFIGVVTTVSTALIAHTEAGRYEFIASAYRVTANRLENVIARYRSQASGSLADLAERCEAILAEENSAWMAKWLKA